MNVAAVNQDQDLYPVLYKATNEDLTPLVEYILKAKISETLSGDVDFQIYRPNHQQYIDKIAKEIKEFGGHSLLNIFREAGVQYSEVVKDVADKVKASYNKDSSIETIEQSIIMKMLSDAYEKMNEQERKDLLIELGIQNTSIIPKTLPIAALQVAIKASDFFAYKLALVVANAIARFILGTGLSFAANIALTRTISILAGPIGWVLTALWTAIDLAGPAYRVTIPCVLHIAMLRQKQSVGFCSKCSEPYILVQNFAVNVEIK
jgi:uncharacterized protein YaaW (UPF0174 family)